MSKGKTLTNQAENMKEMLSQKDELIKNLFSLVDTLETDLNEAYAELETKGPSATPSNIAHGPAGGHGQD